MNEILAEKNRLAREQMCLPERLAVEFERGRRYGVREGRAAVLGPVPEGGGDP